MQRGKEAEGFRRVRKPASAEFFLGCSIDGANSDYKEQESRGNFVSSTKCNRIKEAKGSPLNREGKSYIYTREIKVLLQILL